MEKVIEIQQFKILSRQFRRTSGDLLNAHDTKEAMRLAKRFINFINEDPILNDYVTKNNTVVFDMKTIIESRGFRDKFEIPLNINEEIAFIYQLLKYTTENFNQYDSITRSYAMYTGAKISDSIREFNKEVVKLLVNHITDYLEEKAIELGIDEKPNAKILIQGSVGQLNFSESGNVQANQQNNTDNSNEELLSLSKDLINILREAKIENTSDQEDAIDFMEETTRLIESGEQPKPSLLRRTRDTLGRIRPVVEDTSYLALQIDKVVQAMHHLPF